MLLAELRQALAAGKADVVQRTAHTLKSTSASLGAQPLAAHCAQLEATARAGRIDQGAGLLSEIEAAYEQAEQALQHIRTEISAQPG